MRRLMIAAACVAVIGAVACQVQGNCETTPSFVEYCSGSSTDVVPCQGHIWQDGTHWESGPLDGKFMSFGAGQTFHMHFRDAQSGQVLSGDLAYVMVQVGAVEQPNVGGGSWILGDDGLSNITSLDSTSIFVQNGTCSSYFFRVVVTLGQTSAAAADAGSD